MVRCCQIPWKSTPPASRTLWCRCREAVRAEPHGWGLFVAVRISRENPSSRSQPPILPKCPGAAHTEPLVPGLCSRAAHGDKGMGSVPEPGRISSREPSPGGKGGSAAWRAREGEAGWTRPPAPGIWGCHWRLEGPGQAVNETGVFGKGNPRSCSSRASG